MPEVPKVLRITIENDPDTENPCDMDGWKIYTYSGYGNHLITDRSEDSILENEEIQDKLARGYAFHIGYSDHGPVSLYEVSDARDDGVIVWEDDEDAIGGKDAEARRKDAASFLEEYTEWGNGTCHWIKIEKITSVADEFDPDDEEYNGAYWKTIETCGGFIGGDTAKDYIQEIVSEYPEHKVIVVGDGSWIYP